MSARELVVAWARRNGRKAGPGWVFNDKLKCGGRSIKVCGQPLSEVKARELSDVLTVNGYEVVKMICDTHPPRKDRERFSWMGRYRGFRVHVRGE